MGMDTKVSTRINLHGSQGGKVVNIGREEGVLVLRATGGLEKIYLSLYSFFSEFRKGFSGVVYLYF